MNLKIVAGFTTLTLLSACAEPAADTSAAAGGNGALASTSGAAVQRGAIGEQVRECWTQDAGAPGAEDFHVHLIVMTDEQNVARTAIIAPGDPAASLGTPLHAFAERAMRAVLAPRCSALPLPASMRGHIHRFDFDFRP